MPSSCCAPSGINDLDGTFDAASAAKEAKRFLKRGAVRRTLRLIRPLLAQPAPLASVLDIGCGAGAAHHELLRRGAATLAVGVDASAGYITAAAHNASVLGLAERTRYHQLDFALDAAQFEPAAAVVMDRVLCCYPNLEQLLRAAAERSTRFLALSFPRNNWWARLIGLAVNTFSAMGHGSYRFYIHPEPEILRIACAAGLLPVELSTFGFWRIAVFARTAPTPADETLQSS